MGGAVMAVHALHGECWQRSYALRLGVTRQISLGGPRRATSVFHPRNRLALLIRSRIANFHSRRQVRAVDAIHHHHQYRLSWSVSLIVLILSNYAQRRLHRLLALVASLAGFRGSNQAVALHGRFDGPRKVV